MRILPPLLILLAYSAGAGLRNTLSARRRDHESSPALIEVAAALALTVAAAAFSGISRLMLLMFAVCAAVIAFSLRTLFSRPRYSAAGSGDFAVVVEGARSFHRLKRFLREVGALEAHLLLALFYFVVMLPFGIVIRVFQDPLRLKPSKSGSFWIDRQQAEPSLEAARRQFD